MGKESVADKALKIADSAARTAKSAAKTAESVASSASAAPPQPPAPDSMQDAWERLLANAGGSEGYYIKIYRDLGPGENDKPYFGRRQFCGSIENPQAVPDIEIELQRLVVENGWGSGTYQCELYKHGSRGQQGSPLLLAIAAPASALTPKPASSGTAQGGLADLLQLATLLKSFKELTGSNNGAGISEIAKTLSDSMTTGAELASNVKGNSKLDGLLGTLLEKLLSGKQPDSLALIERLMQSPLVAAMLRPAQQAEDKGDLISQAERTMDFVDRLRGLAGGGAPEKESPMLRFLGMLMPHLPVIAEKVTGTIDRMTDLKRLELLLTNPDKQHLVQEARPAMPAPRSPMDELATAIQAGDVSRFPAFEQMILSMGDWGGRVLEAAKTGQLTAEAAQELLAKYLPALAVPGSPEYVARFIGWLRHRDQAPAPAASAQPVDGAGAAVPVRTPETVTAICQACGEPYDYDNRAEYDADDRKCDRQIGAEARLCGGDIVIPNEPGQATP